MTSTITIAEICFTALGLFAVGILVGLVVYVYGVSVESYQANEIARQECQKRGCDDGYVSSSNFASPYIYCYNVQKYCLAETEYCTEENAFCKEIPLKKVSG